MKTQNNIDMVVGEITKLQLLVSKNRRRRHHWQAPLATKRGRILREWWKLAKKKPSANNEQRVDDLGYWKGTMNDEVRMMMNRRDRDTISDEDESQDVSGDENTTCNDG